MTLSEVVVDAVRVLEAAGIPPDQSRQDAAVLARHELGWDHARWLTHRSAQAPVDFAGAFARTIARRARREPIAYILGTREFYSRTFLVTPEVLVPRPETEFVVEEAMAAIAQTASRARPLVVDVGTGSGCVAITIALEAPDARVIATDTSGAAIGVARQNSARLGAAHVTFMESNLLDGLTERPSVIVSNPPYVPEGDRASLDPEVREFEPAAALFAGPDGLDVIRALVPAAAERLAPGGWLVFEIGIHQDGAVRDLIAHTPLMEWRHTAPDLQGIPRVVVARRI
jgi:release factor glutamine methyltransferase